jgi:hypothetical protein
MFAATVLLECQTRSGSAAICFRLRCVVTLSGRLSTIRAAAPVRAYSSSLFDQQPRVVSVFSAMTLYQGPTAFEFFTLEIESLSSLFVTRNRLFLRYPYPAIPA